MIFREECFFGKKEKCIKFYEKDKYYCYYVDFIYKNKIIEFYGDYFHGNPNLYEKNDVVGSKYKFNRKPSNLITSPRVEDIWKRDEERIEKIKNQGYEVLIIWEKDYKNNDEEIKNKCIKWIKNL